MAGGSAEDAADRLAAVVAAEQALGRTYEKAALELDLARALDAAGRPGEGDATRTRAQAYLDSLGCVNPY